MTEIIRFTAICRHKVHGVVVLDIFRVQFHEVWR